MLRTQFHERFRRDPFRWRLVVESLTRPYPVSLPMILLVLLVPLYLFIPDLAPGREVYAPEIAVDRAIPLRPEWAVIYGSLYLFLIVLPVLTILDQAMVRRTVFAYLSIWVTAYLFFALYPTVAPRPESVDGEGFAAWSLQLLYDSDPPYNCFPSLHVAHSLVSALAVHRVHRGVGGFAIFAAGLVALSTLFTKQHYVLDVLGGVVLASLASGVFLRRGSDEPTPDLERRHVPPIAIGLAALIGAGVIAFWAAYRLREHF